MAKKNYEFRPDQSGSSFLSKLAPTRNQRYSLLRWTLYGLLLLLASLVQDVALSQARLFGATTDLVPCVIFTICMLLTVETGTVFCLVTSLLYLFSGGAAGYYSVPLITFLGTFISIFRHSYLRKGFSATMLCTAACMILYELAVFVFGLAFGLTHLSRLIGFAITGGLSFLAAPIAYPIALSISKIGGETWKE